MKPSNWCENVVPGMSRWEGRQDIMIIMVNSLWMGSFNIDFEAYRRRLMMIMNRTSICGTPLGAGGNPLSSNSPKSLFAAAISLSPLITVVVKRILDVFNEFSCIIIGPVLGCSAQVNPQSRTLENFDLYLCLTVRSSREHLTLLRWDRGISAWKRQGY